MEERNNGMLILTRRIGEQLRIGQEIIVKVMGMKGTQCQIGVLAPRNIEIHREEIFQRIIAERAANDNNDKNTA